MALPPAITDSRTYRCNDNSLVYVDFYNNNTALVRRTRDGAPTDASPPPAAPRPMLGEGYTISGNGTHVTINGKSCHT